MAPPLPIDRFTGAVMMVEHSEHEIFEGNSFKAMWESATAGAGEETALGWLTPALPTLIHMVIDAWANDESILEFREAPAITVAQGTAIALYNRFRGHENTSRIRDNEVAPGFAAMTRYNVAQANNANLAGGTILHHETLAIGGTGPFASVLNVLSRGDREMILLPETEYVAIIEAVAVGGATNNIILHWEETVDAKYKH